MDEFFIGPTDYTPEERKLSEAKIEKAAKAWAKRNSWHCRKWSSPGQVGVPDDIFIKEGRVVVIEAKRIGNTPTGLQHDELKLWRQHGGEAYWCNTVRGYKEILEGIYE